MKRLREMVHTLEVRYGNGHINKRVRGSTLDTLSQVLFVQTNWTGLCYWIKTLSYTSVSTYSHKLHYFEIRLFSPGLKFRRPPSSLPRVT